MYGSAGTGAYVASEKHHVLARRLARPQTDKPVLFFWGVGGSGASLYTANGDASWATLVDAGYVVMNADWGSSTHFGNDTAVSRAASGKTYLQGASSPIRAATGDIYIFATSMGGLAALNYARANPTDVAAIVLSQGAVDLADLHTNNRGGHAATIEAAYGGVPASSKNPAANTAQLEGIPIKLFYSTGDTIVLPATQTAFDSAIASCSSEVLGSHEHGAGGASGSQILSFFESVA